MYQLVFKGECTPGTDSQAARDNAKALFKANPEQIARMFSGQRVVIRNRLDEAQADKYKAVLARHGMIAYVEPMPGSEAPAATPSATEPAPQPAPAATPRAEPESTAAAGSAPAVEPGDRLPVAGEKVDSILAGSQLTLDPVGVTLAEAQQVEVPIFEHLDEWSLAPAGSDLAEKRETPPPLVPDVSHLSVAPLDEDKS
ncbi:MAG: hypothetical protein LAT63_12430 [Marinobacter sp.]|nr:hypothetical protein [Marinobacter sp.]